MAQNMCLAQCFASPFIGLSDQIVNVRGLAQGNRNGGHARIPGIVTQSGQGERLNSVAGPCSLGGVQAQYAVDNRGLIHPASWPFG